MSSRLVAALGLALAGGAASAQEWTTPDGNAAVRAPDPTRFAKLDLPQTLVLWQSHDERLTLEVSEIPAPPGVRLERTEVEQGMMKELGKRMRNGQLLASSSEVRDGHEILTLTARAEQDGTTAFYTQTLGLAHGKVYKALAVGFGRDTRTDSDAARFIASFHILGPPDPEPPTSPAPEPSSRSVWAKRIGWCAIFAAAVLWVMHLLTRKR